MQSCPCSTDAAIVIGEYPYTISVSTLKWQCQAIEKIFLHSVESNHQHMWNCRDQSKTINLTIGSSMSAMVRLACTRIDGINMKNGSTLNRHAKDSHVTFSWRSRPISHMFGTAMIDCLRGHRIGCSESACSSGMKASCSGVSAPSCGSRTHGQAVILPVGTPPPHREQLMIAHEDFPRSWQGRAGDVRAISPAGRAARRRMTCVMMSDA
jgi:hypothetical protein